MFGSLKFHHVSPRLHTNVRLLSLPRIIFNKLSKPDLLSVWPSIECDDENNKTSLPGRGNNNTEFHEKIVVCQSVHNIQICQKSSIMLEIILWQNETLLLGAVVNNDIPYYPNLLPDWPNMSFPSNQTRTLSFYLWKAIPSDSSSKLTGMSTNETSIYSKKLLLVVVSLL